MAGRLHRPTVPAQWRSLIWRIGILIVVVITTVLVMHFEGGLVDTKTGAHPDFLDTLYFTMVTITTVGYGDIVPVSTFARMVDTFFLTPMRFIFFILFVGIAYQISIRSLQEEFRMKRVAAKLHGHTVVCGFGETGRVAVEELLAQGVPPDRIVVLETDESALDEAAKLDVIPIHGDARREKVLKSIAIDRAAHVIICTGRDDTSVLAALTVHDLSPGANIAVMCHESENVKLIERSGAHTIISPAAGYMLAAATRRPHLVATMKDLLGVGGSIRLEERPVHRSEVGQTVDMLDGILVVRLYRGGKTYSIGNFPTLESDDLLVYIQSTAQETAAADR